MGSSEILVDLVEDFIAGNQFGISLVQFAAPTRDFFLPLGTHLRWFIEFEALEKLLGEERPVFAWWSEGIRCKFLCIRVRTDDIKLLRTEQLSKVICMPNDMDHRLGATRSRPATQALSPGSVHPFCSATS